MEEHKKKDIEYELSDTILGTPHDFTVEKGKVSKKFRLYPVTLAKVFLIKRLMDSVDISKEKMLLSPQLEAIRLVREHREVCCHIVSLLATPNTRDDVFDMVARDKRSAFLKKNADDEDLATLIIVSLTWDKTQSLIEYLGLDEENARKKTVMDLKRKNDKNNLTFGGLSMFGTFIGQLKEMGYSDDEVIFEKGYSYLRMMLADKITSVYMTDDEMKQLPDSVGGTMVDANDPDAMYKLRSMLGSRGVQFEE